MKHSPFTRVFDRKNNNFCLQDAYNRVFLHAQEQYLNDYLRVSGVVFLNDVYKALGMHITQAGTYTGWVSINGPIEFEVVGPDASGAYLIAFNVNNESVLPHLPLR